MSQMWFFFSKYSDFYSKRDSARKKHKLHLANEKERIVNSKKVLTCWSASYTTHLFGATETALPSPLFFIQPSYHFLLLPQSIIHSLPNHEQTQDFSPLLPTLLLLIGISSNTLLTLLSSSPHSLQFNGHHFSLTTPTFSLPAFFFFFIFLFFFLRWDPPSVPQELCLSFLFIFFFFFFQIRYK